MLILTNAVSEKTDEGCLKVAFNLIKRIKTAQPDVQVVSYNNRSALSDHHFTVNKLLLNGSFLSFLRRQNTPILYIPFPAKTMATALRVFLLSRVSGQPLRTVLVMKDAMNRMAKLLLKNSRAEILVLSKEAELFYRTFIPAERITYIRTGVDTRRFVPVSQDRTKELKRKYGFDPDRSVVLHVGHLKYGRGVAELLKIDPRYQVLLVASTLTKDEWDQDLREKLAGCGNIRIMDGYIPNIEEVYQLSDVYLFPVRESGNCIDVPLSCLEAAACGKPVITTDYGEMREFIGKSGFYRFDGDVKALNQLIGCALRAAEQESRSAVLEYDWNNAVSRILDLK